MKVRVKFTNGNDEIVLEANPRMRDFEGVVQRMVREAVDSALAMGIVRRKEE